MTAADTAAIRFIVLIGGLPLYVYLYATFLKDIWDAPTGTTVVLDNQDVKIASAIGGALAALFAVALGVERKDPDENEKKVHVRKTITSEKPMVGTICVWVYFLVGVATLYVLWRRDSQAPQEIKAAGTVFAGYVTSIFVAALPGPGQTT